jgi:hypothetical protein
LRILSVMRSVNLICIFLLLFTTVAIAQSGFDDDGVVKSTFNGKVQLYPNPATEYLHVRLNNVKVISLKLSVRNIIGNNIPVEIEFLGDNDFRLRVKELTIGYYLLAMHDEASGFKGTYKFLKR